MRCSSPPTRAPRAKLAGAVRTKLGEDLSLIDSKRFEFCWIVDFPMFEFNEELQNGRFSTTRSRCPQGGLKALNEQESAHHQRLSVRHRLQRRGAVVWVRSGTICRRSCYKAFEIAGYPAKRGRNNFVGGMLNASSSAPRRTASGPGHRPHRHAAGGREELREVIAFPLNQRAETLDAGAVRVPPARLKNCPSSSTAVEEVGASASTSCWCGDQHGCITAPYRPILGRAVTGEIRSSGISRT